MAPLFFSPCLWLITAGGRRGQWWWGAWLPWGGVDVSPPRRDRRKTVLPTGAGILVLDPCPAPRGHVLSMAWLQQWPMTTLLSLFLVPQLSSRPYAAVVLESPQMAEVSGVGLGLRDHHTTEEARQVLPNQSCPPSLLSCFQPLESPDSLKLSNIHKTRSTPESDHATTARREPTHHRRTPKG